MASLYPELAELKSTLLMDGEEDVKNVIFLFPNEKKLKCSSVLLSKVSPVFEKMFSETWRGDQNNVIKMDDKVNGYDNFDQYTVFKSFLAILYGLCDINSLSLSEPMKIYYYSNKYRMELLSEAILEDIGMKIAMKIFSPIELKEVFNFVGLFELDHLANILETSKLNLTEENCQEFYELTTTYAFTDLQRQVVDYCSGGTIKPNQEWTPEFLCAIIENLQLRQDWCPDGVEGIMAIPKPLTSSFPILPFARNRRTRRIL